MSWTIAFFFTEPLLEAGGVGRVTEALAEELTKRGHTCIFVSLGGREQRGHRMIRQMFLPDSTPTSRDNKQFIDSLISREGIDVIINQTGLWLLSLRLLRPASKRVPIINVHHNCVSGLLKNHAAIVKEAVRRRQLPAILLRPGVLTFLRKRARRRMRRTIRRASSGGNCVVFLFEAFREEARIIAGKNGSAGMAVIPNPCPYAPDLSNLKKKKNVLLYVGRIEYAQKRLDRLCRTWERTCSELTGWTLEIVGDGPDEDRLASWIQDSGVPRVNYHGRTDSRRFMQDASLLLLTSDFEGFGMVLVEAQALCCVPLSTHSFSAIDRVVVPDKTGVLVERDDQDALCTALLSLARSEKTRGRMARAGVRHVERFSIDSITERWLELIEKQLASGAFRTGRAVGGK